MYVCIDVYVCFYVCNASGMQLCLTIIQPWPVASFSANSVIVSCEPTSRATCSGLSTVPITDYAVWSRELSLEGFASTSAIAMVHLEFASFGLRNRPFHDIH